MKKMLGLDEQQLQGVLLVLIGVLLLVAASALGGWTFGTHQTAAVRTPLVTLSILTGFFGFISIVCGLAKIFDW